MVIINDDNKIKLGLSSITYFILGDRENRSILLIFLKREYIFMIIKIKDNLLIFGIQLF